MFIVILLMLTSSTFGFYDDLFRPNHFGPRRTARRRGFQEPRRWSPYHQQPEKRRVLESMPKRGRESEISRVQSNALAEQQQEAHEKAKAEREERFRKQRLNTCAKWESDLKTYMNGLKPLKLKPEVHRMNDHFDAYTVFVQLPIDLSVADLRISVKGPTLTLSAERPITIPKYLQGYDFCEPENDVPSVQSWSRTWEFESPIEANEVCAEMLENNKLKLEFPNPPEHETFNIPITESRSAEQVVSNNKSIQS